MKPESDTNQKLDDIYNILQDIDIGVRLKPQPPRVTVVSSGTSKTQLTFGSKRINPSTTGRVRLTNELFSSITIRAGLNNVGTIYIGDINVSSTNGVEMSAGDTLSFTNYMDLYFAVVVANDYVTFVGSKDVL